MALWKLLSGIHTDKNAKLVEKDPQIADSPEEMVDKNKNRIEAKKFVRVYSSHPGKDKDGKPTTVLVPSIYAGEVFESNQDMTKLNRGTRKFELVQQYRPVQKEEVSLDDGLETMTIPELKKMAKEEDIDLGNDTSKADIIETIRTALVG